jgi:hypothetical protein
MFFGASRCELMGRKIVTPGNQRSAMPSDAQAARGWQQRLQCELRQEMIRAAQKDTGHQFPPRRNPITPLGANGPYALPAEKIFTASATFAQLNGGHDASAKRVFIGNPIFGYSTQQAPPERAARPTFEMQWELRTLIAAERSGRKAAESKLRAMRKQ